jgi:DNA polymerase delta subunit 2
MLEDESGRIRLIGAPLETAMLVTGCIVAVMGTENANGDFEIADIRVPDLPRQPQRWERDDSATAVTNGSSAKQKISGEKQGTCGGKIAIVSTLGIGGGDTDGLRLDMLTEYLSGEASGTTEQSDVAHISRLIIAGNALAAANPLNVADEIVVKRSKKYGYDASAYDPKPTAHLDSFLSTLLPSMPVTLIPGESDPANVSLPQQPIHPAMLPKSRIYGDIPGTADPPWFDSVTNPWEGDIDGWRFMGNGGQPIDDVFKYVEGDDRIMMMENLLRWRCGAPTAPDTLCESRFLQQNNTQRSR